MIDALGNPQSVLLLGGSSDIGLATLEEMLRHRLRTVILAGRDVEALGRTAERLRSLGAATVEVEHFDALDATAHDDLVNRIFDRHDNIDVVLAAFGVLGDQALAEESNDEAVRIAATNYVGVMTACLPAARRLREQGNGVLVVLSSVAGERARRANFVYGSSKAGADAFAQGLGDAVHGSGARVLIVRPGFVRSSMTSGLDEAPMACTPDAVAEAIVAGIGSRAEIIHVPAKLRWVFAVLRHLPRPLFRLMPR